FPFLSPDGRWVGFFTGAGGELKKVSITGGLPITLCRYSGTPRGASWGADGTIVFASNDTTTGLLSASAGGGEPKTLTKPEPARVDVVSDPVPVVEQVVTVSSGASDFRVAGQGTLVYVPGSSSSSGGPNRSLVWVARDGRQEPINAAPRAYTIPRLSPDETQI